MSYRRPTSGRGKYGSTSGAGSAGGPPLGLLIGAAIALGAIGLIAAIFFTPQQAFQPRVAVDPTAVPEAPAATAAPAAAAATTAPEPTAAPEATTAPAAPAATGSEQVNGDATVGAALFVALPNGAVSCNICHNVAPGSATLVGPSLSGVGTRAATRVPGQSAVEYMRTSIIAPNDYVVETFTPGLMTQTYGQQLTSEEIDDLIAYMLTLP